MRRDRRKKSIISVLISIFAVMAAGVGLFLYLLFSQLNQIDKSMVRFLVPGKAVVELERPGKYTIYHEFKSEYKGERYAVTNLPTPRVTVMYKPQNKEISVEKLYGRSSYSFGDTMGRGLMTFDVSQPGKYEIRVAYQNGSDTPKTVFAVGEGMVRRILTVVFGGLAVLFSVFGISAYILIKFIKGRQEETQHLGQRPPSPEKSSGEEIYRADI